MHYLNQRNNSLALAQKQMSSLIQKSDEKVSLMTFQDSATGSLSLAITDEENVSKLHLDMNQLSAPDKIWFHKQANEVLYANLTKEILGIKISLNLLVWDISRWVKMVKRCPFRGYGRLLAGVAIYHRHCHSS